MRLPPIMRRMVIRKHKLAYTLYTGTNNTVANQRVHNVKKLMKKK
ncbi:hypothetical protein COMNV_01282 [Commensalibacter sp. Nvir]|nr:hypothetical protein COMNV_01282 [Commensalibacter sp. Nvir]